MSEKKINININIIFYIVYLMIYVVTVSLFGFGNSIANFRYYALMILCAVAGIRVVLTKKAKQKEFINKSFLFSIIVSIVFLFFSYQKSFQSGIPISIRTYVQISLFLFPTIYAFYISNYLSIDNIIKLMKITMVILIFAYFFDFQEKSHHILQFFSINNWRSIDYIHSNSFTESHNWSEAFLQLFLFFYYFYNSKETKRNDLKKYVVVSFCFTMLSFKRLAMLIAIFFLFFGKKIINYQLTKEHKYFMATAFTILTVVYTMFMQNKILDYNTVFDLTSGRNWILMQWQSRGYLSYGYGSSLLVIGRYLEMDLVQIYLELNLFSLFLFVFCYFNICKKNMYCNCIMFFFFMNLLTASSLPWQISWVVIMISISAIIKSSDEKKCLIEKIEEVE